jgi:hypothetical protein
MIRAILDTSSLYTDRTRRQLQEVASTGLYTGIWSPWIIAELNRVLTWRWIRTRMPGDLSTAAERACAEAANSMMTALLSTFEVVAPRQPYPPTWATMSDPNDYPIWAAAVAGQAEYVVSENTRHYPPRGRDGRHTFDGITYLPAETFLTLLLGDERTPI